MGWWKANWRNPIVAVVVVVGVFSPDLERRREVDPRLGDQLMSMPKTPERARTTKAFFPHQLQSLENFSRLSRRVLLLHPIFPL